MGNRANVIFVDEKEEHISPCVYLHWNGGPESIYSFINELNRRIIRNDQNYECSRFIQLVGEFFDIDSIDNLSLGITNGPKKITIENLKKIHTDQSDNGFYVICRHSCLKDDFSVRRFVTDYKDDIYTLREYTKAEVEVEREAAYKSDYIQSIHESFIKIQGTRTIGIVINKKC